MERFPFTKTKYCQYKHTFLQNVMVSFNFDSTVEVSVADDSFADYLKAFFGLEKSGTLSKTISISRKDNAQSFLFAHNHAEIFMNGQKYEGFSDTAIPMIFKMRKFFNDVVRVEKINSVSIRKINVWNIKRNGKDDINPQEVMKLILSQNLLSELSNENLNDEERAIPHFLKSEWKEDQRLVTVRTSLIPPASTKDEFYHLLLDTQAFEIPTDGYTVDEVSGRLLDLNSIMFYAYHWCVSEEVLTVMNKE